MLKQENIGQAFEKDEDKSDAGNSATDSDDSGHQDEVDQLNYIFVLNIVPYKKAFKNCFS